MSVVSRRSSDAVSPVPTSLRTAKLIQSSLSSQSSLAAAEPSMANTLSSGSRSTSLERRACRICQSESGIMVRPCGCSGTMGDIHDECLSKWIATAPNPNECEICKEKYCKGGYTYRSLSQWTRPSFLVSDLISMITLVGLIYSVYYLVLLIQERLMVERVFRKGYSMRPDDLGRLFLVFIFVFSSVAILKQFIVAIKQYINKQRVIKFVNKHVG